MNSKTFTFIFITPLFLNVTSACFAEEWCRLAVAQLANGKKLFTSEYLEPNSDKRATLSAAYVSPYVNKESEGGGSYHQILVSTQREIFGFLNQAFRLEDARKLHKIALIRSFGDLLKIGNDVFLPSGEIRITDPDPINGPPPKIWIKGLRLARREIQAISSFVSLDEILNDQEINGLYFGLASRTFFSLGTSGVELSNNLKELFQDRRYETIQEFEKHLGSTDSLVSIALENKGSTFLDSHHENIKLFIGKGQKNIFDGYLIINMSGQKPMALKISDVLNSVSYSPEGKWTLKNESSLRWAVEVIEKTKKLF